MGTRGRHQAGEEAFAAQDRRESRRLGNERGTNNTADVLFSGVKEEPGGGRRRSRVSPGGPGADFGADGFSHERERLLWDDLRESVQGAAGSERVPAAARSEWVRGVAIDKTKEERSREQRRRRLIDEAIAVLLEGSSSGASSSNSSSDDERLEDGTL